LDVWEPEILRVMTELGNSVVNAIYEGKYYDEDNACDMQRASENCEQAVREAWIKAKYIDRRFIPTLIPKANMDDNRYMPAKWCVKKFRRSYKK
jgi:Arf-GAP with coiled-coil, ANK repeat and PH domain-containing protein